MRDYNRIFKILRQLGEIWLRQPDLRLGQLIENAIGANLFYIEDAKLIKELKNYMNHYEAEIF